LFFIKRCFKKNLLKASKQLNTCLFCSYLILQTGQVFSEENVNLSDQWKLTYGGILRGNFRAATDNFYINNIPNQNLDNQATSAAAFSTDYLSVRLGLELKDLGSIHTRIDYLWQNPIQYNPYPNNFTPREVLLRDLYLKIPFESEGFSIWFGRRTFEYDNIYLFQASNPFDQIELQGFGFETEVFQASLSLNKETVFTTGEDQNGNQIVDNKGKPELYPDDDYIFTAYLSGRFLLAEGKIFQPILTLRAYQSFSNGNPAGVMKNNVTVGSSFIAGGIFSRPMSDGLKGTTTIWFESLPADKEATPDNNTTAGSYYGEGRIPPNYPQNTIGFADSSEYFFNRKVGLLSGIVILNNTYAKDLTVLKVSDDGNSLVPDGTSTSRTTNRISIDLQPVFYFNNNFQFGIDTNFNYVSKKLIANDANSFFITPILKYAFDGELKTNKYLFTSISYGVYDWKIKTLPNGSRTDNLFTTQTGINFSF
jgi:hypothetical protein